MLWASDGTQVGVQSVPCYSPGIIEPGGSPFRLLVDVPVPAGSYRLELRGFADAADPVNTTFTVQENISTSRQRALTRVTLRERGPVHLYRGRSGPIPVHIENGDSFIWLATSDQQLPERLGAISARTRFVSREAAKPRRALVGANVDLAYRGGYFELPHDLAPGDSVSTTLFLRAPPQPGSYDLTIELFSKYLQRPKDAPSKTLASAVVVE